MATFTRLNPMTGAVASSTVTMKGIGHPGDRGEGRRGVSGLEGDESQRAPVGP